MNFENEIKSIINNFNNRQFTKVIESCERIIKLKVENSVIYNFYGLAFQKQGIYKKSIEAFEKSIQLQKNNFLALNNLAVSFKAIDKIKLAEKMYQTSLKIKPDYVIGIFNYANLKKEINDFDEAIKLYLKVLEFKSEVKDTYVFYKLSEIYQSLGDFKKAKDYAKKIIEIEPENIDAHVLLSKLIDHKKDSSHLLVMEKIINNKKLNKDEIMHLAFAMGAAYDNLKNYQTAFKYFKIGNDLKKQVIKYELPNHIKLQNSIIEVFEKIKDLNIEKKLSKERIIFICGMPRSGTTLIEQIISSHNQVLATSENNYLSSFIKDNYLDGFVLSSKKILKDLYSKENFFQDYVFKSISEYNFKSQVYTDKSVQNFFWLGFIKVFFPNSKIIITDRNSKDVCLSIFKINFKNGFMNFSYNQKDIANFYNLYLELTNYWKKLFPNDIYVAKYENLIKDPEIETRKLIDFCELEWDSNCLRHDKNRSAIKTASVSQARQPIYKSSINTSDNYSKYLEEMFNLLKN